MADTEVSLPVATDDSAEGREQLRVALHESAVALTLGTLRSPSESREEQLRFRIECLGFSGEAAQVFDLLPLVHVAWADGKIQTDERAEIIGLLRIRGVPLGPAYTTMLALLEKEPTPQYLEASLGVLREVIERGSTTTNAETIVGLCIRVAEAAGSFWGLTNPISAEEKEAIAHIAEKLGPAAVAEFQRRLG